MALEAILDAIRREADDEVASITAAAEWEVAAALARAGADGARAESEAAASRDDETAEAVARLVSQARRHADDVAREACEDGFGRLRREVARQLGSLRAGDDYPAVLVALVEECVAALPEARTLHVDERDAGVAAKVVADLGLDVEVRTCLDTSGGVRAVTGDGRLVDDTFEARLARAEPYLRQLLAVSLSDAAAEAVTGG